MANDFPPLSIVLVSKLEELDLTLTVAESTLFSINKGVQLTLLALHEITLRSSFFPGELEGKLDLLAGRAFSSEQPALWPM